jgi:ABC-type transporter Mla maintaining outer membrane lipid asymmetry ATPase subunit MlaF
VNAAVEFTDVVFPRSGGRNAAIEPISFRVQHAEICAVGVPPGVAHHVVRAGLGLVAPVRGHVRVLSLEPCRLTRSQRRAAGLRAVAWLHPAAFLSNMPLRSAIALPLLHEGRCRPGDVAPAVERAIETCGIQAWADRRPADVPPDVLLRASLARALAPAPSVVFADDFVSESTDEERQQLIAICRRAAFTLVLATPAVASVAPLVDQVADFRREIAMVMS